MKAAFLAPVIISALAVIPAFFIAKRIAGDIAVQTSEDLVSKEHVAKAESLSRGIGNGDGTSPYPNRTKEISKPPGDYFF